MKKKLFKTLALVAATALSGMLLTNCGGSDNGAGSKTLPTDGILGSFPQKYYECIDGMDAARADMAVGTAEEAEAGRLKLKELQEQLSTMAETEGLASIEIPTEFAAGIPFKAVKPLVITKVDDRLVTLEAKVESTDAVDQYAAYNYGYLVAYDTDGKPFSTGQHGTYTPDGGEPNWAAGTKGTLTIYLSIAAFNVEGLSRLGKLLVVTKKSEEMKQANAAVSELQSAAMEKAREALKNIAK